MLQQRTKKKVSRSKHKSTPLWKKVLRWFVGILIFAFIAGIGIIALLWWRGMLPSRAELPRYVARIMYMFNRSDAGDLPEGEVIGIDVSHYQANIKWSEVCFYYDSNRRLYHKQNKNTTRRDIDFVIAKATQGTHMTDSYYKRNKKGARKQNIPFGAYHFYSTESGAVAQAKHFIKTAELQKGDLYPVLDVELYNGKLPERDSVAQWLKVVGKYYGVKPIIYTNESLYITYFFGRKQFSDYPLWIARYGGREPSHYHAFWQTSENGTVAGISHATDLNVFRGTKEDLNKYRL